MVVGPAVMSVALRVVGLCEGPMVDQVWCVDVFSAFLPNDSTCESLLLSFRCY